LTTSLTHFRSALSVAALALGAGLVGCAAERASFDSTTYLRQEISRENGGSADDIKLPFELAPPLIEEASGWLRREGRDSTRASGVVDYIFSTLKLQYALAPTRDADGTFTARSGNCLSFVNLFVALGRHVQLSPFYVEVEDYQRWDHRQGMVISQGHIVAGLYISGGLRTYDFMPYRVKSYKEFRPIEDLTATAHFYNNLGAEALLEGDMERAFANLSIAARIDPLFVKGANNLGVWHARQGDFHKAIEIYTKALQDHPDNVPLMTNLARAYQKTGRNPEADVLLAQLEGVHHTNPFFYVYRADMALGRGDAGRALDYLRHAYELDTEAPEVHLALARVYVSLGELRKAKHHLGRATRLEPNNPEALKLAAMLKPALSNVVEEEEPEPKP
jgi:tetratricopeptide (TPR) repeat protein